MLNKIPKCEYANDAFKASLGSDFFCHLLKRKGKKDGGKDKIMEYWELGNLQPKLPTYLPNYPSQTYYKPKDLIDLKGGICLH